MDQRFRSSSQPRWSWIIGIVGAILLLGFCLIAAFVEVIEPHWIAMASIGVLLLGIWGWRDRTHLNESFQEERIQNNGAALFIVVLALGLTVSINAISLRYNTSLDLTLNKRYTLQPQSASILSALDKDVYVTAFFIPDFTADSTNRLLFEQLSQAAQQHTRRLHIAVVNPQKSPLKAQQYAIESTYGTVVIESQGRQQRLEYDFGETSFVNAIVQVAAGTQHLACFSEGAQESALRDSQSAQGMGVVHQRLTSQNYRSQSVHLLTASTIPEECDVLVVAGPQKELPATFHQMLTEHLLAGRHAFLMLDPITQKNLSLEDFGILVGDDYILEQHPSYQLQGGDLTYVVLDEDSFVDHPLQPPTNTTVLLQGLRSIQPSTPQAPVTVLATTTEHSWAETEYLADLPSPTDGNDTPGPVPIFLLYKAIDTDKSGQLLVLGTSTLVHNSFTASGTANADLFLNSIAFLVGESAQINQRAKEVTGEPLQLNLIQIILVWFICLIVSPGAILIGAIGSWRERKTR